MNYHTVSKRDLLARIKAGGEAFIERDSRAEHFAEQFLRRTSDRDLQKFTVEQLIGILRGMAEFVAAYNSSGHAIRVYNPVREKHGYTCAATVVEMVAVDSPFLVDTMTMRLTEMGQTVQLAIHPVMWFAVDDGGHPVKLMPHGGDQGSRYSLIHIQIEKQISSRVLNRLKRNLQMAMAQVKMAVDDWQPMQQRVEDIIAHFNEYLPAGRESEVPQSFLKWLLDDNFTFLGYREYVMVNVKGERELQMVQGSGLGIMRHDTGHHHRKLISLSAGAQGAEREHEPIIITKTNARSPVHRSGHMDYIGVLRYDKAGKVIGEYRILGLFTSHAYNIPAIATPMVKEKIRAVLRKSGLRYGSHEGKALLHILETLPRDELFQADVQELYQLGMGVLDLQERPQTRLFIRQERYGRYYSCLVYIPRERYNTENRIKIERILKRGLCGEQVEYSVQVSESNLALLHIIVRPRQDAGQVAAAHVLQERIWNALTLWRDGLKAALIKRFGEEQGIDLTRRFERAFPTAYRDEISPWVASYDIEHLRLLREAEPLRTSLYAPRRERVRNMLRFKVFRLKEPLPLSSILPTLENLGMLVISERPYRIRLEQGRDAWIQDFDIVPRDRMSFGLQYFADSFKETFTRVLAGIVEDDGFNRLVVVANLHPRQIAMLRCYCRYLLQTGIPFSQNYMQDILAAHPILTLLLTGLFEARFAPGEIMEERFKRLGKVFRVLRSKRDDDPIETALDAALEAITDGRKQSREDQQVLLQAAIEAGLETVASLDEDRVIRDVYELIKATLRTNFFCRDDSGEPRAHISMKFDSSSVPELPRPRPFREIWVHSPRMEGIHMRGGMIARGGLRWSDRREDFRTEILSLMKAQNVKNTMIVPVGAKGGFIVKQPPDDDREALKQEAERCYRTFIHGMLDITDNLVDGKVVTPANVVRHDGDDSYLVVAADKGTATLSDTANEIAIERGFWLGDAFASGGSQGYDHKAMGITAKGAWELVKRHFLELGKDIRSETFTVVGIGDMGGDVFGNGMLLSRNIRLQAAFNHLHIFIDPDPDTEASREERTRLFNAAASGWDQYRKKLISKGGGVYLRSAKSIPITPQVREWLGIDARELPPQALIRELLKAPCDLLWNGGIGTYVKASHESHEDVGDRINNALRVNGAELRCRVVGEGGNLGFTRLGRVEYALAGGRINTDFIDNSAGVDCSDHEVNIKILLAQAIRRGHLDQDARNRLLKDMTGEVEQLVLRSNYLQALAISNNLREMSGRQGVILFAMRVLERQGLLDRELEFLPDNETLQERHAKGMSLTRPELAVLLSFSKIALYQQLLDSDVPEDPYLARELQAYFPHALRRDPYTEMMQQHPLRREIIATRVTNNIINRMGVAFIVRQREDTGAEISRIAKAYTVAREVFDAQPYWQEIEALDGKIDSGTQLTAFMHMWDVLRQATRWLVQHIDDDELDIQSRVDYFQAGVREVYAHIRDVLPETARETYEKVRREMREGGCSEDCASHIATLQFMNQALDIVDEARQQELPVEHVLGIHFGISLLLQIDWLRAQIETLPAYSGWEAHARGHLRTDLTTRHRHITRKYLNWHREHYDGTLKQWLEHHEVRTQRIRAMLEDMHKQDNVDIAAMTVAVRSLEQLVDAA